MQDNIPKFTQEPRPTRLGPLPFWLTSIVAVAVTLTWIPLALIAKARFSYSEEPRVSYVQDMGTQPKYREQQSSEVFADGRADRLPIAGTVPRGKLEADDHYFRGFTPVANPAPNQAAAKFFDTFPDRVKVTPELLKRGQQRFNIYCSACHGYDASGHGMINDRGIELSAMTETDATGKNHPSATWVQAADLRSEQVRSRPVGHIYNTINVGIRNMGGYGPQVPVEDRWAIVSYVRALQLSQNATPDMLPADQRGELK